MSKGIIEFTDRRFSFEPPEKEFWERANYWPLSGEPIWGRRFFHKWEPHVIIGELEKWALFEVVRLQVGLEMDGIKEVKDVTPLSFSRFDYARFPYCHYCGRKKEEGYYDDGDTFHTGRPSMEYFRKNLSTYCPVCERDLLEEKA